MTLCLNFQFEQQRPTQGYREAWVSSYTSSLDSGNYFPFCDFAKISPTAVALSPCSAQAKAGGRPDGGSRRAQNAGIVDEVTPLDQALSSVSLHSNHSDPSFLPLSLLQPICRASLEPLGEIQRCNRDVPANDTLLPLSLSGRLWVCCLLCA